MLLTIIIAIITFIGSFLFCFAYMKIEHAYIEKDDLIMCGYIAAFMTIMVLLLAVICTNQFDFN